jgi:hypothetical protein
MTGKPETIESLRAQGYGPKPGEAAVRTFPGWRPQDSVCFQFSDQTGARRTDAELAAFAADVRAAANLHGFDLTSQSAMSAYARYIHRHFDRDGSYRE